MEVADELTALELLGKTVASFFVGQSEGEYLVFEINEDSPKLEYDSLVLHFLRNLADVVVTSVGPT